MTAVSIAVLHFWLSLLYIQNSIWETVCSVGGPVVPHWIKHERNIWGNLSAQAWRCSHFSLTYISCMGSNLVCLLMCSVLPILLIFFSFFSNYKTHIVDKILQEITNMWGTICKINKLFSIRHCVRQACLYVWPFDLEHNSDLTVQEFVLQNSPTFSDVAGFLLACDPDIQATYCKTEVITLFLRKQLLSLYTEDQEWTSFFYFFNWWWDFKVIWICLLRKGSRWFSIKYAVNLDFNILVWKD